MTRFFARIVPVLFSLPLVACGYDNDDRQRVEPEEEAPLVSDMIDTDQALTDLTTGTGLFVEYASGGKWKIQTTCDLVTSKNDCLWDVYAYTTIGTGIASSEALDLEADDLLNVKSDGELTLYTNTGADIDGVSFVTAPGEPITFEFYLDGARHPEDYFFYVSGGTLVSGVGSTAVKLAPTIP